MFKWFLKSLIERKTNCLDKTDDTYIEPQFLRQFTSLAIYKQITKWFVFHSKNTFKNQFSANSKWNFNEFREQLNLWTNHVWRLTSNEMLAMFVCCNGEMSCKTAGDAVRHLFYLENMKCGEFNEEIGFCLEIYQMCMCKYHSRFHWVNYFWSDKSNQKSKR